MFERLSAISANIRGLFRSTNTYVEQHTPHHHDKGVIDPQKVQTALEDHEIQNVPVTDLVGINRNPDARETVLFQLAQDLGTEGNGHIILELPEHLEFLVGGNKVEISTPTGVGQWAKGRERYIGQQKKKAVG